jgi:hypothetical protein
LPAVSNSACFLKPNFLALLRRERIKVRVASEPVALTLPSPEAGEGNIWLTADVSSSRDII